jgi:hypothetical protein
LPLIASLKHIFKAKHNNIKKKENYPFFLFGNSEKESLLLLLISIFIFNMNAHFLQRQWLLPARFSNSIEGRISDSIIITLINQKYSQK